MSDMKTAILDAAQKRIQLGGFGGFSFRDIADDVGVKSSSVHYHFPTKDDLAAAVARRWAENAAIHIDEALEKEGDPTRAWVKTLRGTAVKEPHMCPCTIMGAGIQDLPLQAASEVKTFFAMFLDKMRSQGLSARAANELLATTVGAIVVANALGDSGVYDRATSNLLKRQKELAS